jgi:rhodanese-related sulfurtransferase
MEDITAEELKERLEKGEELILIDVREPYEFEEDNLKGRLIPLGNLPAEVDDLLDFQDSEVIIHCRSGARSSAAKAFLTQNGFSKVRNLLGGILAYRSLP